MNAVFAILSVQALIGAFDNLWHHELEAKLPSRISARYELALHASRESIYAILFLGLAWFRWEGAWAWVLAGLLAVEIVITLADFIEEDLTRRLPKLERVLHTVLAISYGAFVAALAPDVAGWTAAPTALPASTMAGSRGCSRFMPPACSPGACATGSRVAQLRRAAGRPPDRDPPARRPRRAGHRRHRLHRHRAGAQLVDDGARVIVLTRDARRAAARSARVLALESLDAIPSETPVEAVVNLAGAPILGGPWTPRRRAVLLGSRIATTQALVALAARLDRRPAVLISASAAGYYGVSADPAPCREMPPPQPRQFQSHLCAAWEAEARAGRRLLVRVVRLRLGVVLGRGGGMLPPMALAARLAWAWSWATGASPCPGSAWPTPSS